MPDLTDDDFDVIAEEEMDLDNNEDLFHRCARHAVTAIVEDMSDRRGLRQEWDQIDHETKREIRQEWVKLVERILTDTFQRGH